jgi:putative transposase
MKHRHSIRLKNYDYSLNGAYFVTICTYQKECILSQIIDRQIHINSVGQVIENELIVSVEKRQHIELDVYAIMPNHIHFIVFIESDVGARRCLAQKTLANKGQGAALPLQGCGIWQGIALPLRDKRGYAPNSLNEFVGNFKSFSTKRINTIQNRKGTHFWQRNYYERIIRNEKELNNIREYIINNPVNWMLDEENPINWAKG